MGNQFPPQDKAERDHELALAKEGTQRTQSICFALAVVFVALFIASATVGVSYFAPDSMLDRFELETKYENQPRQTQVDQLP